MTPEAIQLVQTTFAQIAASPDGFSTTFYDRMFMLDPPLRKMFPADLAEQKKKLFAMLALAVNDLHRGEAIAMHLKSLAERHVAYGVEPRHYETAGQALIYALGTHLDGIFTPSVRNAWTVCYASIADVMLKAVHDP